jgi:hypothetical protein
MKKYQLYVWMYIGIAIVPGCQPRETAFRENDQPLPGISAEPAVMGRAEKIRTMREILTKHGLDMQADENQYDYAFIDTVSLVFFENLAITTRASLDKLNAETENAHRNLPPITREFVQKMSHARTPEEKEALLHEYLPEMNAAEVEP